MAKGDIDLFKESMKYNKHNYTLLELRNRMIEYFDLQLGGIHGLVLYCGFSSVKSFVEYKQDEPDFKAFISGFIDSLPKEIKEYLYASLKDKNIRPNSSLTKEQRKVKAALNSRLKSAIKGKVNTVNFTEKFGYSQQELVEHLESKFEDWMTWDNHGQFGWHIDHIKPCSVFDWNNNVDETIKECFALSNLQPLHWHQNIIKGNQYVSS